MTYGCGRRAAAIIVQILHLTGAVIWRRHRQEYVRSGRRNCPRPAAWRLGIFYSLTARNIGGTGYNRWVARGFLIRLPSTGRVTELYWSNYLKYMTHVGPIVCRFLEFSGSKMGTFWRNSRSYPVNCFFYFRSKLLENFWVIIYDNSWRYSTSVLIHICLNSPLR